MPDPLGPIVIDALREAQRNMCMSEKHSAGRTVWRSRPYQLMLFDRNERLITSIELSEDQAAALGNLIHPVGDGIGDYDLHEVFVQMGPK